jgi:hypothetical protein
MVVYFATVTRLAPVVRSGELVRVDWDRGEVLDRVPMASFNPKIDHDPNPRGGTRGFRGVLVSRDEVIAATYHSLHVFNHDLKPLGEITHPLFSNLHELAWQGDSIWVTSTGIDAAFRINRAGQVLESWWPREDPETARHFNLHPLEIDKSQDNRLRFLGRDGSESSPSHVHLNAVAVWNDRPRMLLNRFGSVIELNPTKLVVQENGMRGCHNVVVTRCNHMLVNDSHHMAVRAFDSGGSPVRRIDLSQFEPVRQLLWRNGFTRIKDWLRSHGRPTRLFQKLIPKAPSVKPIYVRGLCETPRGTVLVGISPASILEIDWKTGRLLKFFS